MTRATTTPEQRWNGLFALLLVALSLGAWGFGHSIPLGITAEEMSYNPVHDAAWVASNSRLLAGESADVRLSMGCFAIAIVVSFLLFRSRAQRKTSFPPVIAGIGLFTAIVGALLIGLID